MVLVRSAMGDKEQRISSRATDTMPSFLISTV